VERSALLLATFWRQSRGRFLTYQTWTWHATRSSPADRRGARRETAWCCRPAS